MRTFLRFLFVFPFVSAMLFAQSVKGIDPVMSTQTPIEINNLEIATESPAPVMKTNSNLILSYYDTSSAPIKWIVPANYGPFAVLFFAQRFTCPGTGAFIDTFEVRIDDISGGEVAVRAYDAQKVTFPDGRVFWFPNLQVMLGDTSISATDIVSGGFTRFGVFHRTGGQWMIPKEFFITLEYTVDGSGSSNMFTVVTDSKTRSSRSPDSSRTVMFYSAGGSVGAALLDSVFSYQGKLLYPDMHLRVWLTTNDPAAPVITSVPPDTAQVGTPYTYSVISTGNPAPTYQLIKSPGGMSIVPTSGIILWQPTATQIGQHLVIVRATNNKGDYEQSFTVTVIPGPGAPKITSTPPLTAREGEQYIYQVQATGNPPLTHTLLSKPVGMIISPSTGKITWTPNANQIGEDSVVVRVMNNTGFDIQEYVVTVSGTIIPPVFVSSAPTEVIAGEQYSYDAEASGTPPPTYHLLTAPPGMVIDTATGLITWVPTRDQKEVHNVTLQARNMGGSVEQTFAITVWTVPVITSVAPRKATVGVLYLYDVEADAYPEAHFRLNKSPSSMTIDTTTGEIRWTPEERDKGAAAIIVRAHNRAGLDIHLDTIFVEENPVSVRPFPLPDLFSLGRNYPNPFRERTSIPFIIHTGSSIAGMHVTLKVLDALGREVATILDREADPGIHRASFDATGLDGGIYFYQLRAGSRVLTNAMLLIR